MRDLGLALGVALLVVAIGAVVVFFDIFDFAEAHKWIFWGFVAFAGIAGLVVYQLRKNKRT